MHTNEKNLLVVPVIITGSLLSVTLLSFIALSMLKVSAVDNVVDDVSISVPIACNLTSTLDSDHTSTIYNGTNTENIGTTTMQVFCNDAEGFAIYAAGYTGNEVGGENSTKLIGMNNQTPVGNISTGIATSGNTSNWSMKVTKVENEQGLDPVAYNPANLTIESDTEGSFSSYHTVPSEYAKVASFSSSTDVTLGSLLKTTYQAYISPTQPAGTYNGQVKYVMVHPGTIPEFDPSTVTMVFHSSGLYFDENNTESTNTMTFRYICNSDLDCYYALNSGQYRIPIGATDDDEWFMATINRGIISQTVDLDLSVLITALNHEGEYLLGSTINVFYRNTEAIFGSFFVGASLAEDAINTVVYRYNSSIGSFENVGGTYIQPASLLNDKLYAFLVNSEGSIDFSSQMQIPNISGESDFINAINTIASQITIPGGSIVALMPDYMFEGQVYIEYDSNSDGDQVSDMPSSPESHSYDWMDGMYELSCQEPSREGYTFLGWYYDTPDYLYQPCDIINYYGNPESTITVTAQWDGDEGEFYIDYQDDENFMGYSYDLPSPTECSYANGCTLDTTTPYRDPYDDGMTTCSYTFDYWVETGNGSTYNPGDHYEYEEEMGMSTTLMVSWTEDCTEDTPDEPGEPEEP